MGPVQFEIAGLEVGHRTPRKICTQKDCPIRTTRISFVSPLTTRATTSKQSPAKGTRESLDVL